MNKDPRKNPLNLRKCTLDPHCRSSLNKSMRKEELCDDCSKCGWNKDVIALRMAQQELKENAE